ncbi:Flavin reductase-like protein [Sphingobium yanoikuyae]|uniref:Flavin reductase-like protein n=1 Tax=Sphingobium yanoikuyae TaxID=13690 RepID=A0A084ESU5_SPHYA|nr:flavin reductase family protein [Sphingobium yanoikuyae]KEZ21037.1 Flavin reductase-like protein [Sphingobium yanoikuyae]
MATEDIGEVSAASAKRARFTRQMRRVPGSVAIIAAQADGARTGLAATAWTSLSADPPMLLVCVNRSASAYQIIKRAGAFSVNLLADNELETVAIFSAQRGLDGDARFLDKQWSIGPRGQPMLESALVTFECAVLDSHDYGTHTIFIGEVDAMGGTGGSNPLIYFDGGFAALQTASNDL